jgi:hypothetical protein
MQDILGRTFSVGTGEYRVVDVRQLSGEMMVYAEPLGQRDDSHKPKRAAFHYNDIAGRIESAEQHG